jgi:hypothetical protein
MGRDACLSTSPWAAIEPTGDHHEIMHSDAFFVAMKAGSSCGMVMLIHAGTRRHLTGRCLQLALPMLSTQSVVTGTRCWTGVTDSLGGLES